MYTEVCWVVWQSRQVQSAAWASIIIASDYRSLCNDQQYDLEHSHLYTHMYISGQSLTLLVLLIYIIYTSLDRVCIGIGIVGIGIGIVGIG